MGIGFGILLLALFLGVIFVFKTLLYICRPNEIIVFSGRRRRLADGSSVGYSVVQHGGRLRVPIIEMAERMDVSTMTVHINISNAYSRGNIPLTVGAIANVKVSTRPGLMDNAVERFLGRDREEVRQVAKETIEGSLRGALAKLTPEQVNEDRLSFVEALSDEAEDDLRKIGIQMDTLKIQSVTDEVNYLDSIGREKIAQVLRDAEIAESDCKRDADRVEAEAEARGRVAQENAQAKIQVGENEYRKLLAELDARARSEEERTIAAAEEARARAEVKLQEIRTELARLRLQADEVLPAEARKEQDALDAAGLAAVIAAEGRAAAEALRLMSEAWNRAGANAEDIFLIQQLEPLLRRIVDRVGQIDIREVNLVDNGDGASLGRLAGAYPATIDAVLGALSNATGIAIQDVLRRPAQPIDVQAARAGKAPSREAADGPRSGTFNLTRGERATPAGAAAEEPAFEIPAPEESTVRTPGTQRLSGLSADQSSNPEEG